MVIIRSIFITTNSVEYFVYAADFQPDILETLEGIVNIKESVVAVGENQFIDGGLNLGTVQLSLRQELNDISVEEF